MAALVARLLPDVVNELDHLLTTIPQGLLKTRIHGDYHLGQVLWDSGDFYIIDFEGEPGRALPERRVRQSPLKDVAGMVRSFSYASQAALTAWRTHHPEDGLKLESWARFWEANVGRIFVQGYRAAAGAAQFVPERLDSFTALCRIYLIEKALYELRYELNNRPDWLHIPLVGLIDLLDKGPGA
jgi:maltose alpha-D-glucosyltransferase/alpha-amylase